MERVRLRNRFLTDIRIECRYCVWRLVRGSGWESWMGWPLNFRRDTYKPNRFCQMLRRVREMKPPKLTKPQGQRAYAVNDPEAFKDVPVLRDFFLLTTYEDGTPREPGALYLVAGPSGTWKAIFKEPTAAAMLRIEAPDLLTLWMTAEEVISSEDAPWQHDEWAASRRPKKRK